MFIIVVFWLGNDSPSGLLFFLARLTSFHAHASLLTVLVCLFILFISCCSHRECLGKHSCMSYPFHIAILITLFFRETTWSKWSKSRLSKTNYNNNNCPCIYIKIRQHVNSLRSSAVQETTLADAWNRRDRNVLLLDYIYSIYNSGFVLINIYILLDMLFSYITLKYYIIYYHCLL